WPVAISYSPNQFGPALLYNLSQHFICLLPLLRRAVAVTVKPPILSFFDTLLAILATVISSTAVVVTEHLEWSVLDKVFTAFLALSHIPDLSFVCGGSPQLLTYPNWGMVSDKTSFVKHEYCRPAMKSVKTLADTVL